MIVCGQCFDRTKPINCETKQIQIKGNNNKKERKKESVQKGETLQRYELHAGFDGVWG